MDEETLMWLQMLMQGMMPQIAGPGEGKDITTSEQAKQRNLFQDNMQIMSDPFIGILASSMGIPGAFDYGQLTEQAPMEPLPSTPTLSAYEQSQDPLEKTIWEMVQAGQPRASINNAIRAAGIDEAVAGDYIKDAETMIGERTTFSDAQAKQASAPKDLSPVEKAYRDAGIPFGTYDEATLAPNRAATLEKSDAANSEFQGVQKQLNDLLRYRSNIDQSLKTAPSAPEVNPYAPKDQSNWENFRDGVGDLDPVEAAKAAWKWWEDSGSVGSGGGGGSNVSADYARYNGGGQQPQVVDPSKSLNIPLPTQQDLQSRRPEQHQIDQLQAQRDQLKKSAVDAHRERVKSNGYAAGAKQATRGRTPQSDALMARQLVQRLMGMS